MRVLCCRFLSSRAVAPLHLTVSSWKCMTQRGRRMYNKVTIYQLSFAQNIKQRVQSRCAKSREQPKTGKWKLGNLKLNEEQKKTLYLKENKLKGKLYRFLSSGTVGTNFQQQRNHPIALMLYMFVVSRGLETGNRSVFFSYDGLLGRKRNCIT